MASAGAAHQSSCSSPHIPGVFGAGCPPKSSCSSPHIPGVFGAGCPPKSSCSSPHIPGVFGAGCPPKSSCSSPHIPGVFGAGCPPKSSCSSPHIQEYSAQGALPSHLAPLLTFQEYSAQVAIPSHLAPLLTFQEYSAQGALPRFDATSTFPFPVLMHASFTSICICSMSFLCTIEGPICVRSYLCSFLFVFVPQNSQLWSPCQFASLLVRRKPVHCKCLSLLQTSVGSPLEYCFCIGQIWYILPSLLEFHSVWMTISFPLLAYCLSWLLALLLIDRLINRQDVVFHGFGRRST